MAWLPHAHIGRICDPYTSVKISVGVYHFRQYAGYFLSLTPNVLVDLAPS